MLGNGCDTPRLLQRREWNMGRNVSRSFLEIADLGEETGINLTCGDKTGVVIMEKNKK